MSNSEITIRLAFDAMSTARISCMAAAMMAAAALGILPAADKMRPDLAAAENCCTFAAEAAERLQEAFLERYK